VGKVWYKFPLVAKEHRALALDAEPVISVPRTATDFPYGGFLLNTALAAVGKLGGECFRNGQRALPPRKTEAFTMIDVGATTPSSITPVNSSCFLRPLGAARPKTTLCGIVLDVGGDGNQPNAPTGFQRNT